VDRVGGRSPKGRLPGPDIFAFSYQPLAVSYQLVFRVFRLRRDLWRDFWILSGIARSALQEQSTGHEPELLKADG
jgi:hypothetical protein